MRSYIQICLALLCANVSYGAENSQPAQTNAVAGTNSLTLLSISNGPVRLLTLEETVRLAIENNLTLRRARFEPRIQQLTLGGAYSYYDPVLSFDSLRSWNKTEATYIQGTPLTGSRESENTQFSPGIQGRAPFGFSYNLSSSLSHDESTYFGTTPRNPSDIYGGNLNLGMRQSLLRDFWIDGGRYSIQVAKKDLKIAEYALLLSVMDVINQVHAAYYSLIAAQDDVKAREASLETAQRLLAENRQRVRVGTMAPLDEKQAESEAALRQADLISARLDVVRAENNLKKLISENYEVWHNVTIQPTEKLLAVPQLLDLQDSWMKAIALRPDYNQAKIDVERRGLAVKYRFNQLFPSLDLVGSYGHRGTDSREFDLGGNVIHRGRYSGVFDDVGRGNNPAYSYGVELSMPLTRRGERASYNIAKAEKASAEERLKEVHQDILISVETAVKTVQSAYERVHATRAAREFAVIALDAEQKKYQNGVSTPFVVLRLQRDLTDARAAEIRAHADYNIALAELYFREGTILDRNRINVTFK